MRISNRISDRAIQAAFEEYQEAVKEDVGDWFAMRLAVEAAVAEEGKKKPLFGKPSENDFEFAVLFFGVAVASFCIGVLVRWII